MSEETKIPEPEKKSRFQKPKLAVAKMYLQGRGVTRVLDAIAGIDSYGERLQLDKRFLFLFEAIQSTDFTSEDSGAGVSYLIRALRVLDEISSHPIILYINSPGGDILAGMALIQTMRDLRSPVHTFVVGQAASMAGIVAVAGAKRFAYPCARWLLHRGKGGAEGDHEDILIQAKELKIIDSYADQVLLNFTKIKPDQLEELQRKDFWLGAKEAIHYGIVDQIVTPRQGPKKWIPK